MRPPESWSTARVTLGIALATAGIWALLRLLGLEIWAVDRAGFVAASVGTGGAGGAMPFWLAPLTATLLHANIFHLGFNLLILVFCGRPTEAVIGRPGFVILYLVGAYAAAAAQYLADPTATVPMIGASGAVSAVLGAYAILFGRNRVSVANATLALWLNALWLMAAWVGLQLIVGFTFARSGAGIAIAAHIGGFLVGVALANPLLLFRYRKA
ncbi:rhomboid family intramembrane serine protease [Sphingosinicella terrae]|uniref:rhomboid family intramembrane serine protease n=1 Tax=Sphingosinicella terrae TaxID=2172047 RepID=UPI000E0D384A|nr:rhomboid family intramembrane serine protease [Sphingosinicella terrae]